MKNKDNFRTRKEDGDSLGEHHQVKRIPEDPAPKEVDKESENTPAENEVYVDLEPDDLHLGDEKPADAKGKEKKKG